ncbi:MULTISPECIES: helix-turn-helix domain-containing protein [Pandoraea]|uniref:XRE family transcriptional regulator n=1 Tax=Pandoraea aquatica TaxID=2508290 RepID=A0A5E4SJI4_9BURK|nr:MULTISPECIES: helix-turn-helix transcriptional regulator [Pandoraea]VVD74952.1 XRE family transcriptional regulator [Pandoraea aquatica]VVE78144.1 XRE family transcriptional regulator [Pandoraea sputorum]
MYTLAERLRWARTKAGLSQEQLGTKAGVTQSTIGNLESGTRSTARRLPQIAEVLGVNALWLAEGKGPQTSSGKSSGNLDAALSGASDAARELVEAILRADQAGEPAHTFNLMLRMLPGDDEPVGRLNP